MRLGYAPPPPSPDASGLKSPDPGGATGSVWRQPRAVVGVLKQARTWAALATLAAAGFALGGCGGGGGGGALSTRTGLTVTRPTVTTETQVQTTPQTQTVSPVVTTTPAEASSNTPWGWIAVGLGVAAVLVIALVLWRRHRTGAAEWGRATAQFNRRCLVTLDAVLAQGSIVTGQVEALAAEARAFEARAPDDQSRAGAAQVRSQLDGLAAALEADRALRFSSPPPSSEQLGYSAALIRQQAEQLRGVLLPPETGRADAWPTG